MNSVIKMLALGVLLGLAACSSDSSERQEQLDSCEQVKEFDDVYKACIEEAQKVR